MPHPNLLSGSSQAARSSQTLQGPSSQQLQTAAQAVSGPRDRGAIHPPNTHPPENEATGRPEEKAGDSGTPGRAIGLDPQNSVSGEEKPVAPCSPIGPQPGFPGKEDWAQARREARCLVAHEKPSPRVGNGGWQGLSPRHTSLYLHTISQAPRRGSSPRVSQTRGPSLGPAQRRWFVRPIPLRAGTKPVRPRSKLGFPQQPGLTPAREKARCEGCIPGHSLRRG